MINAFGHHPAPPTGLPARSSGLGARYSDLVRATKSSEDERCDRADSLRRSTADATPDGIHAARWRRPCGQDRAAIGAQGAPTTRRVTPRLSASGPRPEHAFRGRLVGWFALPIFAQRGSALGGALPCRSASAPRCKISISTGERVSSRRTCSWSPGVSGVQCQSARVWSRPGLMLGRRAPRPQVSNGSGEMSRSSRFSADSLKPSFLAVAARCCTQRTSERRQHVAHGRVAPHHHVHRRA